MVVVNLGPVENTSESEDPNRKGRAKNIHSCRGRDNSSYTNVDRLFGFKDIWNFISDDNFLVRDSNGEHTKALEYYFRALERNPFLPQAFNNMAVICHYVRPSSVRRNDSSK